MKQQLGKLPSDKARIRYIAEQTAEITGLHDFPQYLTLLFEIDSLILNDDLSGMRYAPAMRSRK